MAVLVLAEIVGAQLQREITARAVHAVSALGPVTVLVAGMDVADAGNSAATIAGVAEVRVADGAAHAHGLAEPFANLVKAQAEGFTHIVAPATAAMKNMLPRAAAMLDVMIIADVTKVLDADTFERPIYAGNATQIVRSGDRIKLVTLRASAFMPAGEQTPAPVRTVSAGEDPELSQWIEDRVVTSQRPELTSARVVVSGGRGVGSAENFALIEKLADKLGGAVGASRAAVDAGYVGNDMQVGQTGKIVAPDIYFAVGISGAIQHLAGMKDSKVIIAINKDAEAPIFQLADFGLVGDLFEVLPELVEKL